MPSIAVMSLKGGVGKTTIAVHLAWFMYDTLEETVVLIDGDPIRSSLRWSKRGKGFPFPVLDIDEPKVPRATWLVVDTEGHPDKEDIEALGRKFDLLVLPVSDIESLETTLELAPFLRGVDAKIVPVVNMAPPAPQTDGSQIWKVLDENGLNPAATLLPNSKVFVVAKLEGTYAPYCSQRGRMSVWMTFDRFGREVVRHVS
jgi:chromosome partitioning protein